MASEPQAASVEGRSRDEEPLPASVESRSRDEERDSAGRLRPGYAHTLQTLERLDLATLRGAVAQHLADRGVGFGSGEFVVDPVPRLLSGHEWDELAPGLAQRGRALNCFLRDAYGEQRVVSEGVIPRDVIDEAEGFEPDLMGCLPEVGQPAAVIGFDLVRDASGEFLVLEDNLRTPSGYSYLLAARRALLDLLPSELPRPRPVEPLIFELLGRVLLAAVPAGRGESPVMVVLTDGPDNVAHYEHALAAHHLGLPLVTPADLEPEPESAGGGILLREADGSRHRVDVVYRRTDEDRIRDERGAMTEVAELLVPAWLRGELGLVNHFGNGVADDKCAHTHVEDFIRFYLGEEPLVRSVPGRSLTDAEEIEDAVRRLPDLVVKPRHGHGGKGVIIGSDASTAELEQAAAELRSHPEQYIVQPIVALSRHPTVIEDRIEPRHVDLRPFVFCTDTVDLLPGGLTRVAFGEGALVVNSSQDGGGKDTWVLDP